MTMNQAIGPYAATRPKPKRRSAQSAATDTPDPSENGLFTICQNCGKRLLQVRKGFIICTLSGLKRCFRDRKSAYIWRDVFFCRKERKETQSLRDRILPFHAIFASFAFFAAKKHVPPPNNNQQPKTNNNQKEANHGKTENCTTTIDWHIGRAAYP